MLTPLYQLFLGGVFVLVSTILVYFWGGENLQSATIKIQDIIDIFITISTVIGTVAAISISFFFFALQSVEAQQQGWYFKLKDEINILVNLVHNLPAEYAHLHEPLDDIVNYFDSLRLREFMIRGEGWKLLMAPMDALEGKSKSFDVFEIDKMSNTLARIEEYASEVGVKKIQIITSKFILVSITKLFAVAVLSLFFVILFTLSKGIYDYYNFFSIPLILFTFYMCAVLFVEMMIHINDYYRELYAPLFE